jgi:beta-lactam-binding protein with PASTA domain
MRAANPIYGGAAFGSPDPNLVRGKEINVPEIQGLTMAQAKDLIESLGLTFTDAGEMDSELPLGTVAKSEPASGEPASVGGEVKVFSSNQALVTGPSNTATTPPSFTLAAARTLLQGEGWIVNVKYVEAPTPANTCTALPPVDPNNPNPTPAPVPTSSPCPPPPNPNAGKVIAQDISGGFVKKGSTVTITVQK